MGYNVEVLRRRRDQLNAWGVRVRWAGRRPKLWSSVIRELEAAEALTAKNKTLTLTMCVNYGSRVEMLDAINAMSADVASGVLKPGSVTEKTLSKYLNSGFLPDVDLFIRSSGEQRISNFLLWQSAYAELVFDDTPWPDFDRKSLWNAIVAFTNRDRRFGGAVDKPAK
jgi:undecaprenyl diphosphate synthase